MTPRPPDDGRRQSLLLFALVLLGLIGIGRLAMEAWMNRPAPRELPEIGARTDEARPLLIVIVDGLREASAWTYDRPPMPWLQSFAERGAWGTAIAGEPTLTAPCVRAILTGRRPDLLTGFKNFDAPEIGGSVVGYLRARGAKTAHGGDAAAFQFCRRHYDVENVLQFPDRGPTDQGECDKQSVPFVLDQIARGATCITMHLTGPDHAGHKWQARGEEYWQACRVVDGQLAQVVPAFLDRHPDGTVLIASDHGVSSMGTHGGGEKDAKRAPFALVGPGVSKVRVGTVDQCALAPTLCTLLGLPMPPLADAPPADELMDLPPEVEEAALDAYVEARLHVARSLHGDAVDFIERERAELTLRQFADRVNALLNPRSVGHASAALLLCALWLVVLVALSSAPLARGARAAAVLASLFALALVPAFGLVSALTAGGIVLAATLASFWALGSVTVAGGGFTLACLGTLPVLTGGGWTLQETFSRTEQASAPVTRLTVAFGAAVLLALLFLKPRRALRQIAERVGRAPGLIAAFGGVLLGFTLTLRPFIDPLLHVMILYAAGGCVVVWLMLRTRGALARPRWERWGLAGVGLVLFVATRVAEGLAGQVWVNDTPMHDDLRLLLGVGCTAIVVALVPAGLRDRGSRPGLALAVAATVFAYAMRMDRDLPLWVAMGANACGLAALGWSLWRGSPDGRLLVRLVTALALARRLSVMDAEFAVFAVAGVGAALAARLTAPRTRVSLAWLAVGIIALRTAVFHAMGFEESFSTLDVGQAFAGLGEGNAQPVDAAGGAVVTWQVLVATAQVALRMSLPWILILAALTRAFQRGREAVPGGLRCVLGDLALSFAARGAAIVTALWGWWRNAWWMKPASTVYAYALADVVLLLACALLTGAWTSEADELALEERPAPA